MNGRELFAAAVHRRIMDAQRGLPPAMVCWVTSLETFGDSVRRVSVSVGNDRSQSMQVLTWSQAFDDRIAAGSVRVGDRVKVTMPPNKQPIIDDVYVSTTTN